MAIASINPATGETLREFAALTGAEIEEKLAAAERAFATHRKATFDERAAILLAAAELLEREIDSLAHTITLEMGKPIGAARAEVLKCSGGCRFYAENGARFLEEETIQTAAAHSALRWQAVRRDPRHHAVEFSVLAGLSFCRACADGG